MQNFRKSVKIWQSYKLFKRENFLRHSVEVHTEQKNPQLTRIRVSTRGLPRRTLLVHNQA